MLRIYAELLGLVREVRGEVEAIGKVDPDLARQLRRCLASAPLNVAEGSLSQGQNRRARYFNALGSLREAMACLECAEAAGYLGPMREPVRAGFRKGIGTLYRVVHPRP